MVRDKGVVMSEQQEKESVFWTIDETARYLRRSVPTIYRWTSQNVIPHIKIENTVLFSPKDIKTWLDTKKIKAGSKRKRKVEII